MMGTPQNSISVTRRSPDVEDYIDMLRRYRSWIVAPMFGGLVVAVVVAFLWPNTYLSYAVMKIKPQQVPAALVPSMLSTQMSQRLEQMEQEILSRTTLQEIIQKPSLDLYKKERARMPIEDIVQIMKNKAIKIIPVMDASPGQDGQRYMAAFQVQFSYPDRYKAQAVVTELLGRFTDQNIRVQKNQASLTTTFMNDEVKDAKDKMDKLDAATTKFKAENQGRLPEQFQANMQALTTLEMALGNVNDALNRAQSDKMVLETQLASLRQQEQNAAAGLETTVQGQSVRNEHLIELNKQITSMKQQLASARRIYKPGYPDIKLLEGQLEALEKEREEVEKQVSVQQANAPTTSTRVVNPQVQAQVESYKMQQANTLALIKAQQGDIEHKTAEQDELNRRIAAYQARIEASPEKEQQYAELLRDFQIAKGRYEDMTHRQQASTTAQDLEDHQAGETLEVLDPANLPDSPTDPNRLAIAGIGTGVGLMLGIMLAGAKEMKNASLKNLKDVRAYTNLPVLSSIPLLENALLVRRKRRLFWLAWSSAVIIGCIAMSGSMYYYYFGSS